MSKKNTDPVEALTRAAHSELKAWLRLCTAAKLLDTEDTTTHEQLKLAAKAWTNAMHQRSRCQKHVREV